MRRSIQLSLSSFAVGFVLLGCGQRPTGVSVSPHEPKIPKAVELKGHSATAYYNRGNFYQKKGQYDRAITDYTKASEINPKYVYAYRNRGFLYMMKLRKKERACPDWKQACELAGCGKTILLRTVLERFVCSSIVMIIVVGEGLAPSRFLRGEDNPLIVRLFLRWPIEPTREPARGSPTS